MNRFQTHARSGLFVMKLPVNHARLSNDMHNILVLVDWNKKKMTNRHSEFRTSSAGTTYGMRVKARNYSLLPKKSVGSILLLSYFVSESVNRLERKSSFAQRMTRDGHDFVKKIPGVFNCRVKNVLKVKIASFYSFQTRFVNINMPFAPTYNK